MEIMQPQKNETAHDYSCPRKNNTHVVLKQDSQGRCYHDGHHVSDSNLEGRHRSHNHSVFLDPRRICRPESRTNGTEMAAQKRGKLHKNGLFIGGSCTKPVGCPKTLAPAQKLLKIGLLLTIVGQSREILHCPPPENH